MGVGLRRGCRRHPGFACTSGLSTESSFQDQAGVSLTGESMAVSAQLLTHGTKIGFFYSHLKNRFKYSCSVHPRGAIQNQGMRSHPKS